MSGDEVPYERMPRRMDLGSKLPPGNLRTMIARTGGDSTVPQIFVDGRYLGTDDTLEDLDRAGRLADILTGLAPPPARPC